MKEKRYLFYKVKTKKFIAIFFIIATILAAIITTVVAVHDIPMTKEYSESCYNDIVTIANAISNGANITEIEHIDVPGNISLKTVTRGDEGKWTYEIGYTKATYNIFNVGPEIFKVTLDKEGALIGSAPNISSKEVFMEDQQNEIIFKIMLDGLVIISLSALSYGFLYATAHDLSKVKTQNKGK